MKNSKFNTVNSNSIHSTMPVANENEKGSHGSCTLNNSNTISNFKTKKSMKKNTSTFGTKSAFNKALETFSNMMIEKIENMTQDWRKPWFVGGAMAWPRNINGREYNGMNALMLNLFCEKEGYEHPVFGTFDAIMSLNYCEKDGKKTQRTDKDGNKLPFMCVRKGAKSMPVTFTSFTCIHKQTKERIPYEQYRKMEQSEREAYDVFPKLNVYNVFNIAQTNIEEVNKDKFNEILAKANVQLPEMNPDSCTFEPIDNMISNGTWICPIKPTQGDNAYYSMSKNEIVVPLKEQFKDGESFYSNLLHEMAHSTGSKEYLDRLTLAPFGSAEYATEELVAELTAALCASRYGMEKHIKEDSAAYLKNWLGSLRKSPDFIKTVLLDVKKASYIITNKIEAAETEAKEEE